MKLSRSTRLSRPSFKVGDGKSHNERRDSSRARVENDDDSRDATLRYHDTRDITDSRRESDESRDCDVSSSGGSLDDQIPFLSESDLPEEASSPKKRMGWGKKKFKGFPIIATIKKKIRRKKSKQNERNMNHLEIVPDEHVASRAKDPEPTQWQKFMDSVAFPENQLGKLYSNFVDYVSNHEKTTPETEIMNYDDFVSVVEERQQSKREPLITDKQWENFMDTIAFPEKSIPALFGATTTNAKSNTEDNTKAIRALEPIEKYSTGAAAATAAADDDDDDEYEEDEQTKDSKHPVNVTMFKKTKFETLGLCPQHVYGRTGIYIVDIVEGSKSANTKLRSGMKILTINGKPCPDTVERTINMLSNLEGYVSIKAVPEAPYSAVSSSIEDIAFAMRYLFTGGGIAEEDNKVSGDNSTTTPYVLGDDSTIGTNTYREARAVARAKEQEEDDDVDDETMSMSMSENVSIPSKKSNTAVARVAAAAPPLKRMTNEIDYVELARQQQKHYELVFDIKKRRGEWVGLSLMRNADWPGVYIEHIDPRSKFASTQLAHGMKLVEINGQACPDDLRQAIYKIFDTNGRLELTVEDSDGLYCHEDGSVVDTLSHDDFRENYGGFLVQKLRLD
ncbi:unnamed protein product [Cylindrotheca closterium]|uniref:PDZ domain-containing protein n=1 Tax=Cylindrotheca closterium TaxID=2856 RepID=A0AAD2PUC0_9STRA|nr:unnamed protein product [Cylindrotheca closterium]